MSKDLEVSPLTAENCSQTAEEDKQIKTCRIFTSQYGIIEELLGMNKKIRVHKDTVSLVLDSIFSVILIKNSIAWFTK